MVANLRLASAHRAAAGAGSSASGGSQPAKAATAAAITTGVTSPALVYTDCNGILPCFPVVRDLVTGNKTSLPFPGLGCIFEPQLSPDGTQIVAVLFTGDGCDGTSQLLNISVTNPGMYSVLATAPTNAWIDYPNWSPDGTTILYSVEQDTAPPVQFVSAQLYTVPAAGGASTALPGGGVEGWDGVYSPDGTKIALSVAIDTSANYLAIMNADGSGVVNLPTTGISFYSPAYPAWSPDGTKLTFAYDKNVGDFHNWGIAKVNTDDTGVLKLSTSVGTTTDVYISSWSADSSEIFYDAAVRSTSTGAVSAYNGVFATDLSGKYRTSVAAATATESFSNPFFAGPSPSTGSASTYTPVTPFRLLPQTTLGAGGTMTVQVTGVNGVPAGATAVTVNLTGVKPTTADYLQAYPGPGVPLVSNLNLAPGQIAAVAVQVTLSPTGTMTIRNSAGSVGVIADVSGYFTPDTTHAGYVPLSAPQRVFDQSIGPKGSADVTVTGLTGTPPNAVAVVANLTAAKPTTNTWLSAVPTPALGPLPTPTVSSLNMAAGGTRANLVTVPIGADGKVSLYNRTGTTRVVLDVAGYYTSDAGGLAYYPLTPTRVLDTRFGLNTLLGTTSAIAANKPYGTYLNQTTTTADGIITVPPNAQAIVFNLTAVKPTAGVYLTVYPDPATTPRPLASNLNAAAGTIVPNLVISRLPADRVTGIFSNAGSTPVIADLAGYYG